MALTTLQSGAPAYAGVLAKLRAMGVRDHWSLNSVSSLGSLNQLRESLGLKRVKKADENVLAEMESML